VGGLNGWNSFFITVLEAKNSKSECQHIWLLSILSLVCRYPLSSCVLTWLFLCVIILCIPLCVQISSCYKDASEIWLGHTLMASFWYNHFLKALFANIVILWSTWGYCFIIEFGANIILCILITNSWARGCRLMVEWVLSMQMALSSIPRTAKTTLNNEWFLIYLIYVVYI
jgi:hypothetical protein